MSVEGNKHVARMYHDLKVEDMDQILTPSFIGHHPDGSTWSLSDHKQAWAQEDLRGIKDIIREQVAEGEWVATWFTRTGTYQGKQYKIDTMHFKRFEGGRIAELWELYDSKQIEA
jgi:hypothetical protein